MSLNNSRTINDNDFIWSDESGYFGEGNNRVFLDLAGSRKRNFTKIRVRRIKVNRAFWHRHSEVPKIRNNISGLILEGRVRIIFKEKISMEEATRAYIKEEDIQMHNVKNDKLRKFSYERMIQTISSAAWRLNTAREIRGFILVTGCSNDISDILKYATLINLVKLKEKDMIIGYKGTGKLP